MEDASLLVLCVISSALSKCARIEWILRFCSTARSRLAWWLQAVAHRSTSATGEIEGLHTPMGVDKNRF